jgi:hypothetical protein
LPAIRRGTTRRLYQAASAASPDWATRSRSAIRPEGKEARRVKRRAFEAGHEARGGLPGHPFYGNQWTIEITGDEMGVDWNSPRIQQEVTKWARARFQGKQFTNKQTGVPIGVSAPGIKEAVTHMPDKKPLKALAKLDELLQESTYGETRAPVNEAPNVKAVHIFHAKANLEGIPHDVKINVKEDNNGHWFYGHHLTEQ